MLLFKIAPVFLLAIVVAAEKKIELQDIEEDNLKSENEKDYDKAGSRSENQESGLLPLEFLKNGLLRYFESPTHTQQAQQPRYVQQYAVTEPPERPQQQQPTAQPKAQYGPPPAQKTMVGYLSNVPMQIYLVPQYYNEQSEQAGHSQGVQYTAPAVSRVAYPTAPEAVQTQTNYIEVPHYITPTAKTFVQQYSPPVAYVSYTAQPTVPSHTQATVAYQMPVQVQYPTAIVAPPVSKGYYQNAQYTETNSVDDGQDNEEEQKHYATQTENHPPYTKSQADYPRYYSSRQPLREEYRHSSVSELPPPNPLLLKSPPPHLSHIPKALPMYRPLNKPVYTGSGFIPNYTQRPHEAYGVPFKRRPTSLLDSYIPSSLQIEYLKRGYHKDPLQVYEALSSGRHFHHGHPPVTPRHYERGFLPNQMYHTADGGITYGHYKRSPPKVDKSAK